MNTLRQRLTTISLRWALGLVLILGLVAVFTALAEDVWFREGFSWDAPIMLAVHRFNQPSVDQLMWILTQTGEAGAIAVAATMAFWFWRRGRWVDVATIMTSLGGAAALNATLKLVFARPRPAVFTPLAVESGFSFPSGHVTASVAVYGALAIYLWRGGHRLAAVLSGAWILVVAFTRVYLGVHYPSDTLAALAFTSLWVILVIALRDLRTN